MRGRFILAGKTVDPARNVVGTDSGEQVLEPKMMDVLCVLAERHGEVVSREELIDLVWGRSFGTDESLTRTISHLRKAFADSKDRPSVIETVSKRGYRLIGEVCPFVDPPARIQSSRTSRKFLLAGALVLALALFGGWLLFRSLSHVDHPASPPSGIEVSVTAAEQPESTPSDRRMAADIMSQLGSALSRVSLLQVTRDAVFLRHSGSGAHPAFLVEGSLIRDRMRARASIALRNSSGKIVWAHDFDRPALLTLKDRDALVDAVAVELSDRLLTAAKEEIRAKPIQSLRPWELNLLATWVPGSDEVFLQPHRPDRFWPQQRALALDAHYAPALATWASGLSYDAMFTPTAIGTSWRARAATHAQRALALAPYNAEVLYALATYYRQLGDRSRALALLDRVLALQPQHPIARLDRAYISGLCNAGAAASAVELARQLSGLAEDNPVRWVALSHMADIHLALGQNKLAAQEAARSREIVKSTWNGFALAAAMAADSRIPEATAIARELRLEWPQLDFHEFNQRSAARWCLGAAPTPEVRRALQVLATTLDTRGRMAPH